MKNEKEKKGGAEQQHVCVCAPVESDDDVR